MSAGLFLVCQQVNVDHTDTANLHVTGQMCVQRQSNHVLVFRKRCHTGVQTVHVFSLISLWSKQVDDTDVWSGLMCRRLTGKSQAMTA